MTVVLCIKCSDGLVMAADTQITERDRGMSYLARKLHPLGGYGAWGGSGARSVLLDVKRRFEAGAEAIAASGDVGRALQRRVLPILQHHYDHFIEEVPGESGGGGSPAAYVLAAGFQGDEPWIVEINPHAMVSHYEDIGFHAIGSGAPLAHQAGSLLNHFRMTERTIDYGLAAAIRVLDALSRTSPSVGGDFNLCRITPDGAHYLEGSDLGRYRKLAAKWHDLEQQTMDKLL